MIVHRHLIYFFSGLFVSLYVTIADAEPTEVLPPTQFVALSVYPESVTLDHNDDYQQLVAIATRADGVTLDVTKLASWTLTQQNDNFAINNAKLTAQSDGANQIVAKFAGLQSEATVTAQNIAVQKPISYRHDVIPVFLRTNCNSGGCHGSSRGKDGFRLSLFGFDPAGDHHRLTREMSTRRLNLALPDESLLLLKATGAVPHTGGKRIEPGSVYYKMLHDWVAAGAPNDLEGAPTVDALEIYPPKAAVGVDGQTQQFVAVATYSDGSTRDVTNLAMFHSSNDATAAVDTDGLVTSSLPGEAFVMARFDTHTVGSQVLVLETDKPFSASDETPANYIDELVDQKLRTLRINPSGLCTDEEFLRRVTIDIAGRLPTVDQREAFLTSDDPNKRSLKIDQLLEGPEFAQLWAQKWAELLLVRTEINRVEYKPMYLYWQWLNKQIAAGRPLNEMIQELLAANGSTFDTPPTNFYQIEPDIKKIAENVAQSFLGTRIQCAQCHNHPLSLIHI